MKLPSGKGRGENLTLVSHILILTLACYFLCYNCKCLQNSFVWRNLKWIEHEFANDCCLCACKELNVSALTEQDPPCSPEQLSYFCQEDGNALRGVKSWMLQQESPKNLSMAFCPRCRAVQVLLSSKPKLIQLSDVEMSVFLSLPIMNLSLLGDSVIVLIFIICETWLINCCVQWATAWNE